MPLFLIERRFAEDVEFTADGVVEMQAVNDAVGVRWLSSFLSADKRKTYCLYEAPNAEAVRLAARRAGVPADAVIEVAEYVPDAIVAGGRADAADADAGAANAGEPPG